MSATGGEPTIEVVQMIEADQSAVVCDFLDGLDPRLLEAQALETLGWGDNRCVTAVVLDIMKNIARGVS